MSAPGLIGGPLILILGIMVMLGMVEAGSTPQVIATIPEFFWGLSLCLWLLIRGFDSAALHRLYRAD